MNSKDIVCIDRKPVYENRWMRVREDSIRRSSGATGIYGVVEKPDFVVIAPVHDGVLYLVEQYRYPVEARYWELPQGSWEDNSDAEPHVVAAGELHEETGLCAQTLTYVGHLFLAYGFCTQGYHVFLATDIRNAQGECERDLAEEDLIAKAFKISEVEKMIVDGVIKDATTIAALSLIKQKGLLS